MVSKAEEIPIICLRPCRRMFKLKSQPPISLFACLSLVWGSCGGGGSYLPSLSSDPLLPMCLSATDPLRDWPLSPTNKKHTHTCTHAQTETHVLLLCALQVLQHIVKHKFPAHAHKHTRNANNGPEPDQGHVLSSVPFTRTIKGICSHCTYFAFSKAVRP